MIIGSLRVELALFEAMNLKDKRRIVLSLKDRIRNRFNVSIAEVDCNEMHRKAVIGVAAVANDRRFIESTLTQVVDFIRVFHNVTLLDYEIEI